MNIRNMRRLSLVPRCSILPTVRTSNVAEHTFHVTWIHIRLCQQMGISITVGALVDTLEHDAEEAVTGDLPATTKDWVDPEVDCPHYYIRKMADIMEFLLTCTEEKWVGNLRLNEAYAHAISRLSRVEKTYNQRFGCKYDIMQLFYDLVEGVGR